MRSLLLNLPFFVTHFLYPSHVARTERLFWLIFNYRGCEPKHYLYKNPPKHEHSCHVFFSSANFILILLLIILSLSDTHLSKLSMFLQWHLLYIKDGRLGLFIMCNWIYVTIDSSKDFHFHFHRLSPFLKKIEFSK